MTGNIRKALEWFNGAMSPSPSTPAGRPGVVPPRPVPALPAPAPAATTPAGRPGVVPPSPTPRNLPGPTAPSTPTPRAPGMSGWQRAAQIAAAVAAGGYGIGTVLNGLGGGGSPPPQPAAPPAGPPAPPPPPPFPKVDPKTATREEMRAAGYRDYGGGWVAPGTPASPRERARFLKEQAVRYRTQIAANPQLYNDIVAAYDAGDTSHLPGSGHAARAVATRALTAHMDAQKEAQIWTNVDNSFKQQNVARQMGVPRGYIMAMEDVSTSARNGNAAEASAKAAMYAERYGQGFLYAARNMTDQHNASEKAKGELASQKPVPPTAVESVDKGMKDIAAMPPGAARKAAIETLHSQRSNGDPAAAKKAVENHYQPLVREMATRLDRLSPDELSELQQVAGGMSYDQFMQYSGLPDTVENQKHFQRIFGKNASYAQFGDNLGFGIGNAIRGLTPWAD